MNKQWRDLDKQWREEAIQGQGGDNQPGQEAPKEQATPVQEAPVQEAPVQEAPANNGRKVGSWDGRFLYYYGSKRKVARLLVDYMEKAMDSFAFYLREEMVENLYLRSIKEEEIASLWWAGDASERITRLRTKVGDDYERYIWDFGAGDATLLICPRDRNTVRGYDLLDAIMRDCWEQRYKVEGKDRRKKIKAMNPLTQEFFDNVEIDYEDY